MEIGGERGGDGGIIKGDVSGVVNGGVVCRESESSGVIIWVGRLRRSVRIGMEREERGRIVAKDRFQL